MRTTFILSALFAVAFAQTDSPLTTVTLDPNAIVAASSTPAAAGPSTVFEVDTITSTLPPTGAATVAAQSNAVPVSLPSTLVVVPSVRVSTNVSVGAVPYGGSSSFPVNYSNGTTGIFVSLGTQTAGSLTLSALSLVILLFTTSL